jgi:DNA-binding IclR family transcriptional regulator
MKKEERVQTIQTTEKALELLQVVANGEHLNIHGLSQRLKISREEVLLLLVAMENRELVIWDNCRKIYSPGGATLEMVNNLTQRFRRANLSMTAA